MAGAMFKAILHVEVRDEISKWMIHTYEYLQLGQTFHGRSNELSEREPQESLECAASVEFIKVDGYSGHGDGLSLFAVKEVKLDVQVYRLHDDEDDADGASDAMLDEAGESGEGDPLQQLRVTRLPSTGFDGLWESLVYSGDFNTDLLRLATRMLTMARNHTLNTNYTNWNGVFLLHGPPGGGKTTLCCGLAQKLKIRLGKIYTEGEMIELNPGALFSKYFGESGKIVGQVFDKIQNRADAEEETLFCLMIDEVETLVSPRERSASGGEVADAMRVTNCILTALDRLRRRPNVMLLCTSNMIEGIDSAFLDRVDMVQFVPNPEPSAVYSILQSSLNELIKQGFLLSTVVCAPESQHSPADTSNYASRPSSVIIDNTPRTSSATGDTEESRAGGSLAVDGDNSWKELDECSVMMEDPNLFPSFAFLDGLMAAESSLAMKLWNFSKRCHGMSGRSLRRLPSKAVGLYTYSDHPSISEALQALQMTLDNEKGITSTT